MEKPQRVRAASIRAASSRRRVATSAVTCLLLAAAEAPGSLLGQAAPSADTSWKAVEQAFGRPGSMQPGGVYKFGMPRSDLTVRVGDVTLKPALALGSWLAFVRSDSGGRATAMGDLVLLESEVGPVMRKLQAGGVEQTALHNHLLGESPHVMYMHVMAEGDAVAIARAVREALALTKTPAPAPAPAAPAAAFSLDTAALARELGYHGNVNGGVYQVSVPRRDPVRTGGMEVPPAMGTATAINFQPTTGGRAAVTGDFVLAADEVNPVIKTLGEYGIAVTAVHSHMLTDEPRLFFMHFWAVADATRLAQGLHAALGQMKVKAPTS